MLAKQVEAGIAVGRRQHVQAFAPEDLRQRFDDRGFVIDDEHDPRIGGHLAQSGRFVTWGSAAALDLGRGKPSKGALRGLMPHTGRGINKRSASPDSIYVLGILEKISLLAARFVPSCQVVRSPLPI